jgi:hypothetical protein
MNILVNTTRHIKLLINELTSNMESRLLQI